MDAAIPIRVVEFDTQSNGFVLPVAGYLSQDVHSSVPQSAASCVPLIPVSSFLLPVGDNEKEANVNSSSVYGSYTHTSSMQRLLPSSELSDDDHFTCTGDFMHPDNHEFSGKHGCSIYSTSTTSQETSELYVQSLSDDLMGICKTGTPKDTTSTAPEPRVIRKKRGRPRKYPAEHYSKPTYLTTVYQPYHPSHFYCPLCQVVYGDSTCPIHPISIEKDSPIPSYARLTLPANLELDETGGRIRVLTKRRLAPSVRFGPIISPMVTESELRCNPEWLPHCPFRVDPLNISDSVRFLKLSDESQCNWMMFVRRVGCSISRTSTTRPVPNCMAYQLGDEGVYFLTIKYVRPGEELVVGYAPPYATQSSILEDTEAHQQSCVRTQPANFPTKSHFTRPVPSDEIHCFRCDITFGSEEAFRIHCLGHPEESVRRGFTAMDPSEDTVALPLGSRTNKEAPSDTEYIKLRKPPSKVGATEMNEDQTRTLYFQSTLQCSLCFTTCQGLSELIEHTNTAHSVREPHIFKHTSTNQAHSPIVWSGTEQLGTSNTQDVEPLFTKSESLYDFDQDPPLSVLSTENFIVVELTNASQNLLEQTYWAYACGKCHQRFPNVLALEQHKEEMHGNRIQISPSISEQRFQLDSDLHEGNVTEPTICVVGCEESTQRSMIQESVKSNCQTLEVHHAASTDCDVSTPVDEVHSYPVPQRITGSPDESEEPIIGKEQISCLDCFKLFRSRSALAVHVRSRVCAPVTPSVRVIKSTEQSNPEQPWGSYESRVPGRTRAKIMRTSHRYLLRCVVCGDRISSRRSWTAHQVTHRRASDKLYPCKLCTGAVERAYKTFVQLRRHVRQVHTNQLFPCPYCDNTFGRRKDLTNHLTRHTGRRDFACPYDGCGKAYSRKDKLRAHMKSHVEERKSSRKSKWWTYSLSDRDKLPDTL